MNELTPQMLAAADYARTMHASDDLELDDTLTAADFSEAEPSDPPGIWVRAWLWVSDAQVADLGDFL